MARQDHQRLAGSGDVARTEEPCSNISSGGRAPTEVLDSTTVPRGRYRKWRCSRKEGQDFDCKIMFILQFWPVLGFGAEYEFSTLQFPHLKKQTMRPCHWAACWGIFPPNAPENTFPSFINSSVHQPRHFLSFVSSKKVVISCSCPGFPLPKDIPCSKRRVPSGGSGLDKESCGSRSSAGKR